MRVPKKAADPLARLLLDLRTRQGLNLQAASEVAGVSTGYLSRLERGLRRPSAEVLEKLAAAYGVEVELLLEAGGSTLHVSGDEIDWAWRCACTDPRFAHGHAAAVREVDDVVKLFVIELYREATGLDLLQARKPPSDDE